MANGVACEQHSGFLERIKGVEADTKDLKDKYKDLCGKIDKIYNVLIGALCSFSVAAILLGLNLALNR